VGPELTFAYRQAVFALDRLAETMGEAPDLVPVLAAAMRDRPGDWRAYVAPGPREEAMMLHGLSDRVRYYWPHPEVRAAVERLFARLRSLRPEPGLVAQVTGGMVEPTDPATLPETVIDRMVGAVVRRYRTATGG
jgi:D-tagatose-1,6-bisphosphate aldolase subunit GatZ/KbaZ